MRARNPVAISAAALGALILAGGSADAVPVQALTIYENDLAGWQADATGGLANVTIDFDEITGPVMGTEYSAMPGGPVFDLVEGTGLAFSPTDQATASSGMNFLTPHLQDSEGIIRLTFDQPVFALGAFFFDVEADFGLTGFSTIPGSATPQVSFSSFQGQSVQSFLGFVSDTPFDTVDIFFATGADIDGTVLDDLRYVTVPEPGTALLVGAGLLTLGMRARRRTSS